MDWRNLLKNILSKLAAQKAAAALTALSPTLIGLFLAAQNYVSEFLADPTGKTGFLLAILLLGLFPLPFATYFWFKPKLIVSQDDGGCWLDVKTGVRYCVSCKTTYKQLVPLTQQSDRWRCNVKGCHACYWLPNENPFEQIKNQNNSPSIYG